MQRSTYSDLALGLALAGVPSGLILEHFPIRHTADAHDGLSRFESGETLQSLTPALVEALESTLGLLSDSELGSALDLELADTIEGDILAEALDAEASRRSEADGRASNGGMYLDEDGDEEIQDWDDYAFEPSYSDRDDLGQDWDDELDSEGAPY